jgi:hypothetical protein
MDGRDGFRSERRRPAAQVLEKRVPIDRIVTVPKERVVSIQKFKEVPVTKKVRPFLEYYIKHYMILYHIMLDS